MLDDNDGSEFPFVHGEHKPTEFVKKENAVTGKKGDLESSFGSTVESHVDIVKDLTVFNDSSNGIDSTNAISQRLEEKVSDDLTSIKFFEITVLTEKCLR